MMSGGRRINGDTITGPEELWVVKMKLFHRIEFWIFYMGPAALQCKSSDDERKWTFAYRIFV